MIAVIAASLLVPGSALAATVTLGEVAPLSTPSNGCTGCTYFQLQTTSLSPSYVVPAGGPWTVSSWSARGGDTTPAAAKLRIFRATSTAGQHQLVAESGEVPIAVNSATPNATSIPVQAGDRIGIRTAGAAAMFIDHVGIPGDESASIQGSSGMVLGETAQDGGGGAPNYDFNTVSTSRVNVSATLTTPDPPAAAPVTKKKCKKGRKLVKRKGKRKCVKRKKDKK